MMKEEYKLPIYLQGKLEESDTTHLIAELDGRKVISCIPSPEDVYNAVLRLKDVSRTLEDRYTIRELAEILDGARDAFFGTDRYADTVSILEITTGRSREVVKEDLNKLEEFMDKHYLQAMIKDAEGGYRGIFDRPVSKIMDLVYKRRKPLGVVFHHLAGNSPMVTTSVVIGVLTKNANLVKTGSGDPATSVYLADAINDVDEKVGETIAVFYWPATIDGELNEIYYRIFPETPAEVLIDGVACWGGETSINTIKKLANASGVKIIEHGPKYSIDIMFDVPAEDSIYRNLLRDSIVSHDQNACISTRVIFVKGDGKKVAENIARYFEKIKEEYPNTSSTVGEVIGKRIVYLKREGAKIYTPPKNSPDWTVVYLPKNTELTLNDIDACMNRFLVVKEIESLDDISEFIRRNNLERYMQVAGIYPDTYLSNPEVTERLWNLGFSKLSKIGEHQIFYPGASHDDVVPLLEFTRYVTADKHNLVTKTLKRLYGLVSRNR